MALFVYEKYHQKFLLYKNHHILLHNSIFFCTFAARKVYFMKRYQHIFIAVLIPMSSFGIIATPEPITCTFTDGTEKQVYLRGDEYSHYMTDLKGEYISGTYVGIDSSQKHMRVPQQSMVASYVPSTGTLKIPVILVNFTDLEFTLEMPLEKFDDLFNGDGGSNPQATGSVATYFRESSNGALILQYDIYGPYNLSQKMEYYGGNTGNSVNKGAQSLVKEAVNLAKNAGIDFAQYDNNGDGYIDNVSIVVAGHNEAEGGGANTIWPHYSVLNSSPNINGKYISGYLMISEYRGNKGNVQAGIGTYCHEFGHALGLPDLYNTVSSDTYTVGDWDIMCSGSYNNNGTTPPSYTAFERFAMGWLIPEQLDTPKNYTLSPIETSNKAYLIANDTHNLKPLSPNPTEYFLLENRQKVGWDANSGALVGTGLLISHITFNKQKWDYNTFNNSEPLGFAIVSAGVAKPIKSTAADLFPGTANITNWVPAYNNGIELTEQAFSNIKIANDTDISFRYGKQGDYGFFFMPESLPQLITTYETDVVEYGIDTISVLLKGILSAYSISCTSYFEFSLDGGATWFNYKQSQILNAPQQGIDSISILVRYAPTKQSCDIYRGYLTFESEDMIYSNQMPLSGSSPRPIYISQPQLLEPEDIASTSFTINWEPQDDADFYYITLYTILPEPDIYRQDFETFFTITQIQNEGWSANFVQQISTVAESGKAILFSKTGQQITSCSFPNYPTKLNFWLSNTYTTTATAETPGGTLLVEGLDKEGHWQIINLLKISSTTKNLFREFLFSDEEAYTQFRFTYQHNGGNGGVVIDAFEVETKETYQYICRDTEREVSGKMSKAIIRELQPSTTYYFAVQAYEYKPKSCEEHYSPLSKVQSITTLATCIEENLIVSIDKDGNYFINLPEAADGLHFLQIFTTQGQLVSSSRITYATTKLSIPTYNLQKGRLYFLKITEADAQISRTNGVAKMLYF